MFKFFKLKYSKLNSFKNFLFIDNLYCLGKKVNTKNREEKKTVDLKNPIEHTHFRLHTCKLS